MSTALRNHPAIDAVLAAAAELLGMEVAFLGTFDAEGFAFERVVGEGFGLCNGHRVARSDSFCWRMLGGAPAATADAASDPHYADSPIARQVGVTSYVGVPVRAKDGTVIATLCGIDRRSVPVSPQCVAVLRRLAEVISTHLDEPPTPDVIIRRTPSGWQVDPPESPDAEAADLLSAMVLADLLAEDAPPPGRPARPTGELDEVARLRLAVTQLEHALAARIVVEQAIGVLSERQHTSSRDAFERLRRVARSRGRRVHDLAREVVGSAAKAGIPLPPELAGSR
jgi:hypothetical protein